MHRPVRHVVAAVLASIACSIAISVGTMAAGCATPPATEVETDAIRLGNGMRFVRVDELLFFATTEVSNSQFRQYGRPDYHPSLLDSVATESNHPVINVTWAQAKSYAAWLNKRYRRGLPAGWAIRLPYHVEWKFVASEGWRHQYPWGGDLPPAYGNYADLSHLREYPERKRDAVFVPTSRRVQEYDDGFGLTAPVSACGTNAWGIHGLAGNVAEWCRDENLRFDRDACRIAVTHVAAGGDWCMGGPREFYTIDQRHTVDPGGHTAFIGIRLVIAASDQCAITNDLTGRLLGIEPFD